MTRLIETKFNIALELLMALAVLFVLVIGVWTMARNVVRVSVSRAKKFIVRSLRWPNKLDWTAAVSHSIAPLKSIPNAFFSVLIKSTRPTLAPPTVS